MPDPLESLRLPDTPVAPRPGFAAALRGRMEAALGLWPPDPATAPSPSPRSTTVTSTTSTTDTTSTETPATAQVLVPYLCVHDAEAALAFYRDAFGAFETMRVVGDDGRMGHCEFTVGGARFMMADEFPEIDVVSPRTLGGTPVTLHLAVVDVDHVHRQAVAAGATSLRPPEDQTHGSRTATVLDPFGHRWMLSQPLESLSPGEYAAREEASGEWTVTPAAPPVELAYVAMPTADLAATSRFFGELFGWQVEPGNAGEGNGHVANTRLPMGMSEQADAISLYFRVDDVEAYAARVEELGGRVVARHRYASGGSVECVDDQGFRFDLIQPAAGY